MANNLLVSYDLHAPTKNYEAVGNAIKDLGDWAKVHYSLYYVKSNKDAAAACDHVWRSMDSDDRLLVVDATNNQAAWQNLDKEVSAFIIAKWHK